MKSAQAGPLIEAFDVILWRRDSTCRVCGERGEWGPGQGGGGIGDTEVQGHGPLGRKGVGEKEPPASIPPPCRVRTGLVGTEGPPLRALPAVPREEGTNPE